jgi:hypothetical protein
MKPSEYIRKGWTQFNSARDVRGNSATSDSTDAVCWCLTGALIASAGDNFKEFHRMYGMVESAVLKILHIPWHCSIYFPRYAPEKWNDTEGRTQQEVIDLLEGLGL